MPDRKRPIDHVLRSLRSDLQRLAGSPMEEVARYLENILELVTAGGSGSDVQSVVAALQSVVRRLPRTFDKRFLFDAALLQGIGNIWSPVASINPLLVPKYESDWGHTTVSLPPHYSRADQSLDLLVRHLDLILMPGEDRLEDIDLLSYPWIVHEVAHNFFFRHNRIFESESRTILANKSRRLNLAASADRDLALRRSTDLIHQIGKLWEPTSNHQNWAHELAVDLMALWVLGPAYLSSFVGMLDNDSPAPYTVAAGHPPYELRNRSLLAGAKELGWLAEAVPLAERMQAWHDLPGAKDRTNRYIALADKHLMAKHVELVFQICRDCEITKCSQVEVARLAKSIDQVDSIEFGTSLLIQAWIIWDRRGSDQYWNWHSSVVDTMSNRLTL